MRPPAHTTIRSALDAIDRLPVTADNDAFRLAMGQVLRCLGDVVGFRSAALVSLDPETWSIDRIFGTRSAEMTALILAFIQDLHAQTDPVADRVLWRYQDGSQLSKEKPHAPSKLRPSAAASIISPYQRPVVMLLGEFGSDGRWVMRDAQSLQLATEFLSLALERRARAIDMNGLQKRLDEVRRREAARPLAGGIAHELNNNLAAIMGYAEMAADTIRRDSATYDYLEEVLDAGRKSQLVIEKVLEVARMPEDLTASFSVVDALLEILPALRIGLAPSLGLSAGLPDGDLSAVGRPEDLQQVLLHLCEMAGERSFAGGCVRLIAAGIDRRTRSLLSHGQLAPGRYIRISLIGGAPALCPTHIEGEAGLPAGGAFAAACEAVVTLLDGALHVGGKGAEEARIDLFLPRCDEAPASMKRGLCDAKGSRPGKGERVVIVDADATSRSDWEERLALLGYEPLGFRTMSVFADWRGRNSSTPDIALINLGRSAQIMDEQIADACGAIPAAHIYMEQAGSSQLDQPVSSCPVDICVMPQEPVAQPGTEEATLSALPLRQA